jgi:hypothetical protein
MNRRFFVQRSFYSLFGISIEKVNSSSIDDRSNNVSKPNIIVPGVI